MKYFFRTILITIIAAFAGLGIYFLCAKGGGDDAKVSRELQKSTLKVYGAVPTDAILLLDFEHISDLAKVSADTSAFTRGLIDKSSGLFKLWQKIASAGNAGSCHTLFSLHYSAIGEVSFIQITDLSALPDGGDALISALDTQQYAARNFNGSTLKHYADGTYLTVYDKLLIASTSVICIEASLRHLANGSSILNNQELYAALEQTGGLGYMFVNHKQLGKLFSGVVSYSFLKFAEFFQRYSSWSALEIDARQRNFLALEGQTFNNEDAINFSTIYLSSKPVESGAGRILPASTMFAVSLALPSVKSYLSAYRNYLEANKKLSAYQAAQETVALPELAKPVEWVTSEGFTEVVSAFCLIGNGYEWVTFAGKKGKRRNKMFIGKEGRVKASPAQEFEYKGYMASLFGKVFSYNTEEQYCTIGNWYVIGSKRAISEFSQNKASFVPLEKYLTRTPASSFFEEKGCAKVVVNIREGADTLLAALAPYYRGRVKESLRYKNFEYATVNVTGDAHKSYANVSYYAAKLSDVPQMFTAKGAEEVFYIDSTIAPAYGPFMLTDGADTLYFEQSRRYLSISLSNARRKGLWGIPMKDTITGGAALVKLSDNKSYIAFIMKDKLYMISRKGAWAGGYPKTLPYKVAVGPRLRMEGDRYMLMLLDSSNVIHKTDLAGESVSGWKDIHAQEFTKELPEYVTFFGQEYIVLRTVARTRIYKTDGEEITTGKNIKPIAKDSPVAEHEDGFIKVMGTDGKEFLLNLKSGKVKKL